MNKDLSDYFTRLDPIRSPLLRMGNITQQIEFDSLEVKKMLQQSVDIETLDVSCALFSGYHQKLIKWQNLPWEDLVVTVSHVIATDAKRSFLNASKRRQKLMVARMINIDSVLFDGKSGKLCPFTLRHTGVYYCPPQQEGDKEPTEIESFLSEWAKRIGRVTSPEVWGKFRPVENPEQEVNEITVEFTGLGVPPSMAKFCCEQLRGIPGYPKTDKE